MENPRVKKEYAICGIYCIIIVNQKIHRKRKNPHRLGRETLAKWIPGQSLKSNKIVSSLYPSCGLFTIGEFNFRGIYFLFHQPVSFL